MKPIGFTAVLVAWLCTPAGAEWHVDRNKNRLTDRIEVIAWTDAAERASTGPRSTRGRARSAQNALRHALSRSLYSDPSLSEEVETFACEIAGPHPHPEILPFARRIAEAQIDLHRVRAARLQFMSDKLRVPCYDSAASRRTKVSLRHSPDIPAETVEPSLTATPQGPENFSLLLLQEMKQLQAFDRYERRALSRRKFAIRDLDGAKARLRLQ